MSTETEERTEVDPADFAPRQRVLDREADDPDPDPAVVLNTPPLPADEWTIPHLETTVAEDNPDYPADDPVVVVAYQAHLDEEHPGWRAHESYWTMSEVNEERIQHYTFPESRLRPADEPEGGVDEGDAEADEGGVEPEPEPGPDLDLELEAIADELRDAGCAVRERGDKLRVSKQGEMYLIKQSGKIVGDGALRDRLEEVIDDHAE